MPFDFRPLEIPEVILVEAKRFPDARGYFAESYKHSEFAAAGIAVSFVQDNFSFSRRGAVRGLHYQKDPAAQGKLVMACTGEIYDVAVDIRRGSPTYGKWVGKILSAQNGLMLYIPPGALWWMKRNCSKHCSGAASPVPASMYMKMNPRLPPAWR